MKNTRTWIAAVLLAALPLAAAAQNAETDKQGRTLGQGIKENAAEAKEAAKKSASEVKQVATKAASDVSQGVKKGTRKAKRKTAVALCNDGKYSYTRTNTCSDHGGIKERLKK
jgi:hypothetical protein